MLITPARLIAGVSILLLAVALANARVGAVVDCEDGLYLLGSPSFTPENGIPGFTTLRVEATTVTLEGCGPADATIGRHGARLAASWSRCGALDQVHIKIRLSRRRGCARGKAVLTARGPTRHRSRVGLDRVTASAVDAPAGVWSWIPTQGMRCADGSQTGIGINPSPIGGNRLIIYMMGGGGCWDATSCYQQHLAFDITGGYGEAKFLADVASGGRASAFNRDSGTGVTRRDDANWVFIPYCTGDTHGGDAIRNYDGHITYQVGKQNTLAAFDRIQHLYPTPDRITLSGSSAGGTGVSWHWLALARRYPHLRVDMLDDCGLPFPIGPTMRAAWNLTFPADCTECATDLAAFIPYQAQRIALGRGALLAFLRDPVLGFFSTFSGIPSAEIPAITVASAEHGTGVEPDLRYFIVDDSQHVMLRTPEQWMQNGVRLVDWLQQMDGDDPTWASVRP